MQICYLRPYLGDKTDFCRLLQRMPVRIDMDWNLKKLRHFFSSFNDMPEEITKNE